MNAVIDPPIHPLEPSSAPKGKALVAGIDPDSRSILGSVLKKNGYQPVFAADGPEAVAHFTHHRPAMVFIDTALPLMNGYEAAKHMRKTPGGEPATLVFITAGAEEAVLERFTAAGGDDYLILPLRPIDLEFRITVMERLRGMRRELTGLHSRLNQEQAMAESVFRGAVLAGNVAMDRIHSLLRPAQLFSGDVLLSAYTPSGDLNVILGDFTGHGLAAALGALPTSEVFRAMTGKGFSPQQILAGINRKLHELMPTGMFFAAQMVSIDRSLKHFSVCNCGMPDSLLLERDSRRLLNKFKSSSLPLGITLDMDFQTATQYVELHGGELIILLSDGVLEARNRRNQPFGRTGLEQAIKHCDDSVNLLSGVVRALDDFCGNAPQEDDISLAEIPFLPDIMQPWEGLPAPPEKSTQGISDQTTVGDELEFCLTLNGNRLRQTDPIPLVINHIQDIEGLHSYRRILFTILTELYVNALDHGVLGLDSNLKNSAEGFTNYFTEREKRLRRLDRGSVSIRIKSRTNRNGGRITINLTDTGNGFDFRPFQADNPSPKGRFSGRGILLLRKLCDSLEFKTPGNQVEAVFSWSSQPPG